MRETRRSRTPISALLIATACGPSTSEPQDETSTGAVATTETSASLSTSESTSSRADTSSSGSSGESTGAALECPGGGQQQLTAGHFIDLSAWPSDDGTSWAVDTECIFVEQGLDDAADWHFACVHPVERSVELVLELDCFFTTCDLRTLDPGETVHLETYVSITGSPRNRVNEIWTVLRDEVGELLFIGVAAQSVESPGGAEATAPLSFELAPPGSCEPTFECADHEPAPILVRAGRESAVVHDSSESTIELGGASYDVSVATSCRGLGGDDDSSTASFVVFPSPDL